MKGTLRSHARFGESPVPPPQQDGDRPDGFERFNPPGNPNKPALPHGDEPQHGTLEHLVQRMIRASRLDPTVYDEIAIDPAATRLGTIVLLVVGLAQGIGSFAQFGRVGVLLSLGSAYFGWLCSSLLVWFVGTRFLHGTGSLTRLLRTMAFAASPQFLWILAALPLGPLELLLGLVVFSLTLVANVVAIRQSLQIPTPRAVGAFVGGFSIFVVFAVGLAVLIAPLSETALPTASAPGSTAAPLKLAPESESVLP